MKATTSIMNANHILLLFCVLCLQIITPTSSCPAGQLKHGNKCCRPVFHCPAGSYVKTCEREGSCDECLPCPSGTENPFITSSFDVKKCYKNNCFTDSFRISETKCKCALHDGYAGSNENFCQIADPNCMKGKELTNRGKCEDCENNHYKYWAGPGYCIRDINCSMIDLPENTGNLTTPTTCQHFEDKCSPKERSPPLPSSVKPQIPTTVRVSSTTATTKPSVPVTTTVRRKITKRLLTKVTEESKPTASMFSITKKPECVNTEQTRTSKLRGSENSLDVFRTQYIYVTVISVLIIIIAILLVYIARIKYKSTKKQKKHDNNYQQIDYLQKRSPNDTQRPLPKKPSSNNLIDTYMEMGKSSSTLKRPPPYFISSHYDPSTLSRLIQQPGGEIPLLPPIYQQNTQAMIRLIHCSPPRQESNASGEEEYNISGLGSSLSMRDCSMGSETALKIPDTAEPNPSRIYTTTMTEATRAESVRVEPFRGDFDPTYQDAISLHTSSDYSPSLPYIQPVQMTQTGIVLPQLVHYAQPMNKTRNREYV